MRVNVLGVMVGTHEPPATCDRRGGSIINVTSIGGITPGGGFITYRAAKAAVIHFTHSAAIEVAQLDVESMHRPWQHSHPDPEEVGDGRGSGTS